MENLTFDQAKALLKQIPQMSEEARFKTYQRVFSTPPYYNTLELDGTGVFHEEYTQLAERFGDNQALFQAWKDFTELFLYEEIKFSEVYQQGKRKLKKVNARVLLSYFRTQKARHLFKLGHVQKAIKLVQIGLEEAKKMNNKPLIFEHYRGLSTLIIEKSEDRIRYAKEALLYVTKETEVVAMQLKANIACQEFNFYVAYENYIALKKWHVKNNEVRQLSYVFCGIMKAFSVIGLDKTISAEKYSQLEEEMLLSLKVSIEVILKDSMHKFLMNIYGSAGNFYYNIRQLKKAIPHYEKALECKSKYGGRKDLERDYYYYLFTCNKGIKNYAKALEYNEKMTKLHYQMYTQNTQNKIAELNAQFEAEKREEEIARLKKENELLDTIKAQKEALEQVNLTKDRLFAIIGHDLRKPVLSFRGIAKKVDYLLKKGDYKTLQLLGQGIEQDAYGLTKLTDNLLNWALTQRDVMPYQPKALNLYHITEDTLDIFKSIARDKKITLEHHIPNTLTAYADQNSVLTILRNLVDNAVKYTPSGGTVIVEALEQEEGIIFKIKDTGVGMSAEKVRDIFLLQKDKSEKGTAGEQGTGLGMHLVQELVKLNKGNIRVMSQLGQGTTFEVVLPKVA